MIAPAPTDTPPPPKPDRPDVMADPLLPGLGLLLGLAVCVLVAGAEPPDPARPALVFGPLLLGLVLPRLQRHHYRALGLIPYAAIGATVVAIVAAANGGWCEWTVGFFSGFLGLMIGAVLRFRDSFRIELRRFGVFALVGLVVAGGTVAAFALPGNTPESRSAFNVALLVVTILLVPVSLVVVARPFVEFTGAMLFAPMYRVSGVGPGLAQLPIQGPCVIIANHAAWFDPLFLTKVFRRPIAPMMTSRFFNIWFLRPLLKHVIRVIVVPEVPVRRDAPEIRDAIQALDAGKCLVIFPEGYLRRKEDVPLRRFGQGVWQILVARPETPVFACWIEGGWGSFVSYKGGPPTKNKRPDVLRRITVAVSAPFVMPTDLMKHHLPTRIYLMNKVLEARAILGLPAVPPVELPKRESEANDDLAGYEEA